MSEIQQIETDVKMFVQNVETTIVQDAEAGYAWLKGELAKLEPEVLALLKAAVQVAVSEALTGGQSSGVVVADVLTILARDGAEVLAQVKSDVVGAVVGLTANKAT